MSSSTSAVGELDGSLQAMLNLKPPGASGTLVGRITDLCTKNIQSESVLVQKLYTHFKKTPPTHKLGVLYVVDSVTRKWTELAKAEGQTIESAAPDGTYAAGVNRVKELFPVLMNDIVSSAPEDQKEKILKLVTIWEKASTFPADVLATYREKLQKKSTTPPGSPPPGHAMTFGISQHPLPSQQSSAPSSILETLARIAKQNTTASPSAATIPVTAPHAAYGSHPVQSSMQTQAAPLTTFPFSQNQHSSTPVASSNAFPLPPQGQNASMPNFLNGVAPPSSSNIPPHSVASPAPPAPPAGLNPDLQRQIMIIKTLSEAGVPQDQWGPIIAALSTAQNGSLPPGNSATPPVAPPPVTQYPGPAVPPSNGWSASSSRDQFRHDDDNLRSPQGRYRRRSRSPSPGRGWNTRDSPTARRHDGHDDRGRNGNGDNYDRYRQRSPQRRGSPAPHSNYYDGRSGGAKWIDHDPHLPKGSIKVLSRTLFVGGVTCSDQELRRIFEKFGQVQTCIVNKDKRHAFVKMVSRKDAVNAKESMANNREVDSSLRTRWGVGFGPRDCSDYTTGVSVIPISKLTDADRKWMLTAEYGGSGGKPIESGMVVEEPDIEIGAGVSSKAISRRMGTDRPAHGGRDSMDRDDEHGRRGRRDDGNSYQNRNQNRDQNNPNNIAIPQNPNNPPPIHLGNGRMPPLPPGFPAFPMVPGAGAAGMPFFPPGFAYPAQTTPAQPPPPGRG